MEEYVCTKTYFRKVGLFQWTSNHGINRTIRKPTKSVIAGPLY